MGQFRMTIEAAGGHGCERKARVGERVIGCSRQDCPDCSLRAFVEHLNRTGSSHGLKATMVHWPGDAGEVTDTITMQPHGIARVDRTEGDFFTRREPSEPTPGI